MHPHGEVERLVHLGGGPNGAAIGPDGGVYICNNGGFSWISTCVGVIPGGTPADYVAGSIQRVDLNTGDWSTLYTESAGTTLGGPNDIVFDAAGGFYFTDLGKWDHRGQSWGGLHYALPDGSHIRTLRSGLTSPNGIGLSPDGKVLYVAESHGARLWAYDVISPGVLGDVAGTWEPGRHLWSSRTMAMYDSLAIEANGNICVAAIVRGGIDVISPAGTEVSAVPIPSVMTTNLCFGGDDMQTVWITGSNDGKLYRARWPRQGLILAFNA